MSLEMSLPHAPRIQQVAADGTEQVAQDEQQWQLYYTVQRALQQEAVGPEADGSATATEEGSGKPTAPPPQPSDPQKVLQKLLTARGELDVIIDLITFVEQQQFLAVEGIHRHPARLEERVRARSLRLAASKRQLRGAGERLQAGLDALQAQAQADNRFLADLAQLRQRWKLRRHSGTGGMFYADISLPLCSSIGRVIKQEGSHCNIIQDTNGDACVVESDGSGKRRAVRGWQRIHAVLELKQRLVAWRVLQQMVAAAARLPRHEADADGGVGALQRMLGVAAAACQRELYTAVAEGGSSSSGGGTGTGATALGATAMDVDPAPSGAAGGRTPGDGGTPAVGALPASMLSSVALDIQAAQALPSFQQQFEGRALLQLSRVMAGAGGGGGGGTGGLAGSHQQQQQQQTEQEDLLDGLLQWLRHTALCQRVSGTLAGWCAAAAGRSVQSVDSGEEYTAVWQLLGAAAGGEGSTKDELPVLVVVQGGRVRVEGGGCAAVQALQPMATAAQRGLSKTELDRLLQSL